MQAAGFGHGACRIVRQLGRYFKADKAGFAAAGFEFGQAHIASGLHIGNGQRFIALFGAEVLLFEGGDFVCIKCIARKGFLENGRVGGDTAHALLQHFCQFAALNQRAREVVQPDLLS